MPQPVSTRIKGKAAQLKTVQLDKDVHAILRRACFDNNISIRGVLSELSTLFVKGLEDGNRGSREIVARVKMLTKEQS